MYLKVLLAATTLSAIVLVACADAPTEPETPRIASVVVTGPDSLIVGDTIKLDATVLDQEGNVVAGQSVEWASSDSTTVMVTGSGEARALADGTATVTASAGGIAGSLAMVVRPRPAVELVADTVVLTQLGDSATILATLSDLAVDVHLTLLSEKRWNSELAVATATGAEVIAIGGGEARYAVHAQGHSQGAAADTLVVRVEPETPYVLHLETPGTVGPDSPMVLHGYGLSALPEGAITAGGEAATVVARDSATINVAFDPIPQEVCVGARGTLAVSGATVLSDDLAFQRQRMGAIRLDAGEARRLTQEEADCIKVEGSDSATYALAYYDARYAYSEDGSLPYWKRDEFSITVADESLGPGPTASVGRTRHIGSAPLPTARASIHDPNSPAMQIQASTDDWPGDPWAGELAPMAEGDTIIAPPYRICGSPDSVDVSIVAVIDGYFVLGIPVDSLPNLEGSDFLDVYLDELHQFSAQHAEWIQDVFARPSLPNGQYLLLVCPVPDVRRGGGAGYGKMGIYVDWSPPTWSAVQRYSLMAHEYAHSAEVTRRWQDSTRTGHAPAREIWWAEGLASMIEMRAGAEFMETTFTADLPGPVSQLPAPVYRLAYGQFGSIESGYTGSAALGYDLVWRVAEASGLTWEAAHDTVTRAMAHNRYGCSSVGCASFDGLYDVARRHLGSSWDPVEGVLTYVASYALDDLIDSTVYRYPAIRRVSEVLLDGRDTGTNLLGPQMEIAAYSGESGTYSQPDPQVSSILAGSAGWYRLVGGGGAFRVTSDAPQLELMLIRLP